MSFKALEWAYSWTLSPTQKVTLVTLAFHSNDRGTCWPGQKRLAQMTGLSERTIRRSVKELETLQLLKRKKQYTEAGARTSDKYTLNLTRYPDGVTPRSRQADRKPRTKKVNRGGQRDRQKGINHHLTTWDILNRDRTKAENTAINYWTDQPPAKDRDDWLALLPNRQEKTDDLDRVDSKAGCRQDKRSR